MININFSKYTCNAVKRSSLAFMLEDKKEVVITKLTLILIHLYNKYNLPIHRSELGQFIV